MNETQAVFSLFFAIFWGAITNVQPKWKPFQFGLFCTFGPATRRLWLSILFFNFLPILFFGWTICVLHGPALEPDKWTGWTVLRVVFRGVIPAVAMFGLYRIWMAILERWP